MSQGNESAKPVVSAVPDVIESHLLPNGDHTVVQATAESSQQATANPETGENIRVTTEDDTAALQQAEPSQATSKKKPTDFHFGKIIGSGSYSEVVLAQEKSTGKEYAIKILEKSHIIKYKKIPSVTREKEVSLTYFGKLLKFSHKCPVRFYKSYNTHSS